MFVAPSIQDLTEEKGAASTPSLTESAAQSTEAAKKGAGDLLTTLRATYNSVAETISELDFSPLGRQAIFVKYAALRLKLHYLFSHLVSKSLV